MKAALCWSFVRDSRLAIHDEANDLFKMALYEAANFDPSTLEYYTTEGEITGIGYTAGGMDLLASKKAELQNDGTVITHFGDAIWPGAVFTTCCALIYNASKSNRAVAILPFSEPQIVTGGRQFIIRFPYPTSDGAVIRSRNAQ